MRAHRDHLALAHGERLHSYSELLERFEWWRARLAEAQVPAGSVVALEGEYGLESVAALLALIAGAHIAVPLSADAASQHEAFHEIAATEWRLKPEDVAGESRGMSPTGRRARHDLYRRLRESGHPGLILFSSGSTGSPKAAVHDLSLLLAKYSVARKAYRTLVFLLLDHIGGVNTLFYTLSNGGAIVTAVDRSPASISRAVEQHRVELLPTSPTFLNLLLLSGEHRKHDLSSLKLITYGTEPMPLSTLERVAREFPGVKLQQTYGMTELGILRSQSRGPDSLWVKVGGEDFETKIVDGRLWIRARCAMLGYLNAPMPVDAEGYFDTGDLVETDGEWVRFLGRESDIINVGGSKVYPAEVESVLLQMPNVADVVVSGEPHALTGRIVIAKVRLVQEEPLGEFKTRMRIFIGERLPAYKMPARVQVTTEPLHSARFKRARGAAARA
jgi:acyl-coenzyme A synthetase/AMP-(fatty) acid ligase